MFGHTRVESDHLVQEQSVIYTETAVFVNDIIPKHPVRSHKMLSLLEKARFIPFSNEMYRYSHHIVKIPQTHGLGYASVVAGAIVPSCILFLHQQRPIRIEGRRISLLLR